MVATAKDELFRIQIAQQLIDAITIASRHLRNVELPLGISRERFIALATIKERGTVSMSSLAEALHVTISTISRMVAALSDEGFVKRKRSQEDARGVLISLTRKGQRVYERANQNSLDSLKWVLSELSEQQVCALSVLAIKLKSLENDAD